MQGITATENIEIYKEIASKIGIKFKIIAKAGEKYLIANKPKTFTKPVPEGKAFISLEPGSGNLSSFWQQVSAKRKEIASQENLLNS